MQDSSQYRKLRPGQVIPVAWVSAILKDTRDGTLYFRLLGDPTQVYRVGEDHRFIYRTESSVLAEEELLVKTVQEDIPQGDGRGPGGMATGRELDPHLRPYARAGYLLRDDAGVHVYNEAYAYLGTLGAQSPRVSQEQAVVEPSWDERFPETEESVTGNLTQQTVYLDPSLVFDIELNGVKYAQRMTGGFFILISPEGEEVFEYFTSDRFMGTHPEKKCLLFRNPVTGETYGKAMDGRRVELSVQPPQEPRTPRVEQAPPPPKEPPSPPPSSREQVVHLLKRMVLALRTHGISADYFVKKTYRTERVPELLKVLEGELGALNGDLEQIPPQADRAGLTLLKAGLVHELYINTTLDGRGGHRGKGMKAFLLEMVLCREDGTLDQDLREISLANRERFLSHIRLNMTHWPFLEPTLKRVFAHWKADEEFLALQNSEDPVRMGFFKAFLISKVYEYTTRLERGNGAEMIDLVRLILDVR